MSYKYPFQENRYRAFLGSSDWINRQTTIWRYMTFEKFCWLTEMSKLYHPRLDQFNDPFEGAVTYAYAKIRDLDEPEYGYSKEEWRLTKENEPWLLKELRFRQFVTCWHASEYESDALWRLYAPSGAGVAIVSTMDSIEDAVDLTPYRFGSIGEVEYVDFDTHNMWRKKSPAKILPGYLKRKSFEHEKEIRGIIRTNTIVAGSTFIRDDAHIEKQRLEQPLGIAVKADLKKLIHSIVISPLAPKFLEELVHRILERQGLNHLVRKSELLKTPVY
jgi:hypothetical protein